MEGPSRLLLDTGHLTDAKAPLLVGAPAADAAALLEQAGPGGRAFFFDETALELAGLGERGTAGVAPQSSGHDVAVVFHPKGKRRRDWALTVASHALAEGGRLVVVGGKREGIGSAKKLLRLHDQRSGRHAKLFVADPLRDRSTDLEAWEERWPTGLGFDAVSYPGTFAEGRLDEATALLLETLALPDTAETGAPRRVLDLGCGSGILGIAAKRRAPGLEVHLADTDHLAVAASRRTAELAGTQVRVHASNATAGLEGAYDVILLNPPFHEGVKTRASAAEGVLLGAAHRLRPEGVLWVVANRFLPHEDVLEGAGMRVERAAETGRFKVLRCTR